MQPKRAGVIGAGTMGHGIAQLFAAKGIPVVLLDNSQTALQTGRKLIEENLQYMSRIGYLAAAEIAEASARVTYTTKWEDLVSSVDYVTEAVSEDLSLKKDLFEKLDENTPERVILTSNTSSFDINRINEKAKRKERILGTHWFHPPQITPCIEIVPSKKTAREVIADTIAFLESLGKAPTICRSAPGFVANRIQYAMVSEALAIVGEGLATPEQIDRIVKTSFGFRLSAFGPLEVCDQAGLDVYATIFKYFHKELKRDVFKPPKILEELVEQGKYGLKNGNGFYTYNPASVTRIRQERDKKLYDRLQIYLRERKESGPSGQ
jgi:3-hydroxybutyryl-CoA dehydrogenase